MDRLAVHDDDVVVQAPVRTENVPVSQENGAVHHRQVCRVNDPPKGSDAAKSRCKREKDDHIAAVRALFSENVPKKLKPLVDQAGRATFPDIKRRHEWRAGHPVECDGIHDKSHLFALKPSGVCYAFSAVRLQVRFFKFKSLHML